MKMIIKEKSLKLILNTDKPTLIDSSQAVNHDHL